MSRIVEKEDVDFGQEMESAARSCERGLVCLWGESKKELVLNREKEIYDMCSRGCLVHQIRQSLQENTPYFLPFWREHAKKVFWSHRRRSNVIQQEKFWIHSLNGVATIYSSNNKIIPRCSENLSLSENPARNLMRKAARRPKEFYLESLRMLGELNPYWFLGFQRTAKTMRISGYAWGLIVSVLRVFLEALEPLGLITEDDFVAMQQFLNSSSVGP